MNAHLNHLDENTITLIINHLKGSSTEEDRAIIRKWIDESPANKRIYDELNDIWIATAQKENNDVFDAIGALQKVKLKIGQNTRTGEVIKKTKTRARVTFYNFLKIASVFILAFLLGSLATKKFSGDEDQTTEISAPIGSKSKITLPDGTQVWLNSGSKLYYNHLFNRKDREVCLQGEAFFDVAKKKEKPFLVKPNEITIKVLGTAFNVKAYPNEHTIETTLVRGSLMIEQNAAGEKAAPTMLEPNQHAIFIKDGGLYISNENAAQTQQEKLSKTELPKSQVVVSKQIETEIFTAWKDNKLIFRNESFESLAIKLERWYGVKINIKDEELKKKHFNGTVVNETIQDVLEIIKFTLPISYTIQHNIITIQKTMNN